MQLSTQFNRRVYRYERHLRKASAALAELASVKKGTESLQAELKEVGGKLASLEEDVAANDALLGKYKAAQADLVVKTKALEADVEKKEATIER